MQRSVMGVFAGVLAAAVMPAVSFAGANGNAKILLHLIPYTNKVNGGCNAPLARPPCSSIITSGSLFPQHYYVHVLVTDANVTAGVAGVQFGISYTGSASLGFNKCADSQFATTDWPASGSGNLLQWNETTNCQRYVPAGNDPANGAVINLEQSVQ